MRILIPDAVINSGGIVCVDVGMAVNLHRDEDAFDSYEKKRKVSVASLDAWESVFDEIGVFFKKSKIEKPNTVNTLKALLFIKNNHPDVENVDFLKDDLDQTEKLAQAHDRQYANVIRTKRSCQLELKKYIDSRVLINKHGIFSSNFTTRIFRDVKITKAKVKYAESLINAIGKSVSIKEIQKAVDSILKDLGSSMKQEGFFLKSNLIKKCNVVKKIISTAIARDEKVVESVKSKIYSKF